MSSRTLEQIFVGSIIALVAAIVNQAFAGRVNYLWVIGGFLGAVILFGIYQRSAGFPFVRFKVKNNPRDADGLLSNGSVQGKPVGQSWQFNSTSEDWAITGPYLRKPLRKGKYRATFRIKVDDVSGINQPIVDIDVASRSVRLGDKRLAMRTLSTSDFGEPDTYCEFPLDFFVVADEQELELRVYSKGSGLTLTLDYIELSRRFL